LIKHWPTNLQKITGQHYKFYNNDILTTLINEFYY
jgi:hypothetical protein